ncbi:hypothetical protein B0H19DRAFT_876811, partial [Mycena capillaripes]
IRTAVIGDVRLALQPNTGSIAERVALLKTCAELCVRHSMEFSPLLQEKNSFHGHTALYWVIANNLASPLAPFELVAAVLSHSQPLTPETIQDARRACISLRSQDMFQFLRSCPEFGALSEEDRFVLGLVIPPEQIDVEIMEGSNQPFSVKFHIPLFQKRMLLGTQIKLEFIARGRLWRLSFYAEKSPWKSSKDPDWFKAKKWGVSLELCENSPSTHLDFGLIILD